jgi:hypothetical protein
MERREDRSSIPVHVGAHLGADERPGSGSSRARRTASVDRAARSSNRASQNR